MFLFWKRNSEATLDNLDDEKHFIQFTNNAIAYNSNDEHEEIASKVYRRLRQRHFQLQAVVREAREQEETRCKQVEGCEQSAAGSISLSRDLKKEEHANTSASSGSAGEQASRDINTPQQSVEGKGDPAQNHQSNNRGESKCHKDPLDHASRAYNLAVTDLFVEKALAYLEKHARPYKRLGLGANILAVALVGAGAWMAVSEMYKTPSLAAQMIELQSIQQRPPLYFGNMPEVPWQLLFIQFSKGFTAYGMIVLVATLLWRYGKAMLDQAERLMERRHALRQGRLFVHLNGGQLDIEELEKAFNWNQSQTNAFASIREDSQAPWGAVAKELARGLPDLVKAGIKSTSKSDGK
jgi:hypothetical protein